MRSNKCLACFILLTLSATAHNALAASGPAQTDAQGYRALPVKKMGSGVEISYRIEGIPAPGSPLIVQLTASSRSEAQVSVRGGEGLSVSNTAHVLLSAGQVTQHRIEVTPQTNGRLYLYVESSANGRGSSNAIAVQVGKSEAQRKPAGTLHSMPNGERVISVPAKQ